MFAKRTTIFMYNNVEVVGEVPPHEFHNSFKLSDVKIAVHVNIYLEFCSVTGLVISLTLFV